jgi:diguanylate cyclase (GGDEF)-like protein/PAS domain S-box-containing protein
VDLTRRKRSGDLQPVRLLLLEDSAADAELLTTSLDHNSFPFVARVVSSELEFRREITAFAPQVILSDFSLPRFDGLSALKIATEMARSTPFIFVSGTIGEELAIEALKRGASDYVFKDNLARLVPAIQNALYQSEVTTARDLAVHLLQDRESRLQDIIDTSADWIWECDADGLFTFSSPAVSDVLGYLRHEVLGRSYRDYITTDDQPRLEAVFQARRRASSNAPVTMRWKHKNGAVRWLQRKMVAVCGENGDVRGFRGIDRDVTMQVAQQARIARLNRALRFLSGASSAVIRIRDRGALLREACRLAVRVGGYGMATIYVRPKDDVDAEPLVYRAVLREQSGAPTPPRAALDGDGPAARAFGSAEPVIVTDYSGGSVPLADRDLLHGMGLRSCIALPLTVDGTAVGAIELHSHEVGVFEDAELALLRRVAATIAFSLQYLYSKESAEYLEYFDPLTALANRALYLQRLGKMIDRAQDAKSFVSLLIIDITGLTIINDGLGHQAGDLLLKLMAERMKSAFGDSSCLCHLGAGRYAVSEAAELDADAAATLLRRRVDDLVGAPFMIGDQPVHVSIKAGFAQYRDVGRDAEVLLERANTALARAKLTGERYVRHVPNMNTEAAERLSLTNRLRNAVTGKQFVLHYQPTLDLRSEQIDGVEALLRWPDSTHGPISAGVFVPMLESLGLIDDVGRWVLANALAEASACIDDADAGLKVAVNVSPVQLRRDAFVDEVLNVLETVPHPRIRLVLEVTESTLMIDPHKVGDMLARLRAAGVSVAIDDFGTGYSSLKLLSRLPVDVLKIDRSFVRDLLTSPGDRLIAQSTIALAKSLGMRTIAEGVETKEQVELLRELGCDVLQGFLIHHPVPADDLRAWLRDHRSRERGRLS